MTGRPRHPAIDVTAAPQLLGVRGGPGGVAGRGGRMGRGVGPVGLANNGVVLTFRGSPVHSFEMLLMPQLYGIENEQQLGAALGLRDELTVGGSLSPFANATDRGHRSPGS